MYIPKHFAENDLSALQELMHDYSFAILVTTQEDGTPFASHLPFFLDSERGPYGTLVAHVARGNAQWKSFQEGREVLVIFQGPHAYVSPSWYDAKLAVPTWNYAAVHAYGVPRIVEDQAACYKLLKTLIEKHESQFEQPWPFHELPDEYMQNMMRGTVPFEIEITRLEGKFKLSQNRPMGDRVRVADILEKQGDDLSTGVSELMQQRNS